MKNIDQYAYISQEQPRSKYVTHRLHIPLPLLLYSNIQSPKISTERLRNDNIKIGNPNKSVEIVTIKKEKKINRTQSARLIKPKAQNKKMSRPHSAMNLLSNNKKYMLYTKEEIKGIPSTREKIKGSDRYKPKDFEKFNSCIINKKLYERALKQRESTKELKKRNLSSYELYFDNNSEELHQSQPSHIHYLQDKQKSDIFFFNDTNKDKKEEKVNTKQFYSNFDSKSEWEPKKNELSMINHESVKYYIYNPGAKTNFITKEEVVNQCNKKIPTARNQILGDYINQTQSASSKVNKEYIKYYNSNKNCFRTKKNLCNQYGDLYCKYKPLFEWPHKVNKTFWIDHTNNEI